eukprot:TRINITY_DN6928_c0_g2_i2.p1 TRINITY_DN6928_c0_g2~~TRINITY_DN6928_c0_g2_i2.p1  ORF type:complete len:360 (-),score=50.75 TRINITY_DN6928_c0_g2_i2:1051-2130(-)
MRLSECAGFMLLFMPKFLAGSVSLVAFTPDSVSSQRMLLKTTGTCRRCRCGPLACAGDALLRLIDVGFPYNKLEQLRRSDDGLSAFASVRRESDCSHEPFSPMTLAELARHSAILGSIAAAAANPLKSKHYYLATQGECELATPDKLAPLPTDDSNHGMMHLQARMTHPFSGSAATVIIKSFLPDHRFYATTKVKYQVVEEMEFRKRHKAHLLPAQDWGTGSGASPYCHPPELFDFTAPSSDVRTARLAFTDRDMAAGHFAELPVLPVAVMAQAAFSTLPLHGVDVEAVTLIKGKLVCARLLMLGETVQLVSHRELCTNRFTIKFIDAAGARIASVSGVAVPWSAEEDNSLLVRPSTSS